MKKPKQNPTTTARNRGAIASIAILAVAGLPVAVQAESSFDMWQEKSQSTLTDSRYIQASEVSDWNVFDGQNNRLGEIDNVIMDPSSGEISDIVVSYGGVFGVGSTQVLISVDDVQFDRKNGKAVVEMTAGELQAQPKYKEEQYQNNRSKDANPMSGESVASIEVNSGPEHIHSNHKTMEMNRESSQGNSDSMNSASHEMQKSISGKTNSGDRSAQDMSDGTESVESMNHETISSQQAQDRKSDQSRNDDSMRGERKANSKQMDQSHSSNQKSDQTERPTSQLISYEVVGSNGQEVGSVEDLLIGSDGSKIEYVVVSSGGFMEIADTLLVLPLDQVEVNAQDEQIEISTTKSSIETGSQEGQEWVQGLFDS
ncbi:MAG: PRC-barrel domain-containing protein [Puniceicoccales bacterium]